MYKRILVPLDGSGLAERALPYAIAQAERFGAKMILLKVLAPLPEPSMAGRSAVQSAEAASADLARAYLESVADRIREQGIPAEVATVEGRPYAQIVEFAEERQIDLIVMSTRGQSGFSRWLLGSVADRVVRGAMVPILLVQALSGAPA